MAVDKGYGSGKPLSAAESRNRRRKAAGLSIRPELTGRMPDKKPGTINKPKPGTKPAPLTPRTPGKVRPDIGYGPGRKPAPGNGGGPVRPRPPIGKKPTPPKPPKPNITRPTTPKPLPPKARGAR